MKPAELEANDASFFDVADLCIQDMRAGQPVSIDKLVAKFPHLSKEIREKMPAVLVLQRSIGKSGTDHELEVGDSIGGCVIEEELGRGAFGIVYRAFQEQLNRSVALKAIPFATPNDVKKTNERFQRERFAMARLEHKNIVPVYTYGHDNLRAFIVMKLIDGRNLRDLANGEGGFRICEQYQKLIGDWSAIARAGANIASGLQHAHKMGTIHRDVKPSNLILDTSGKVWVMDFGLAKLIDANEHLTLTGDVIGTPRYMAPEQLRNECDVRSDVYSLGITLFELALGPHAWTESSHVSTVSPVNLTPYRSLKPIEVGCQKLPTDLGKIIAKACQLDPDLRYQTAEEMRIVLERFADGVTPSDRRGRRRDEDSSISPFKRRKVLAAVGTVALAVFASIGFLWSRSSANVDSTIQSGKSNDTRDGALKAGASIDFLKTTLAKLTEEPSKGYLETLEEEMKKKLLESRNSAELSDQTRAVAFEQINDLIRVAKEAGLAESMEKSLKAYRELTPTKKLRVMLARDELLNSQFPVEVKRQGAFALNLYSAALGRGLADPSEMDSVIGRFQTYLDSPTPTDSSVVDGLQAEIEAMLSKLGFNAGDSLRASRWKRRKTDGCETRKCQLQKFARVRIPTCE